MPNRLANETSPYLQQHAENPVDWYPWGEEALAEAQRTGKPILLSVGYSACHWCHVMAHESFEDPATAKVMNEKYVNIKVDREERPDIDQIYQVAQLMLTNRNGGWPLTMFLTPGQLPFFGGTYFPNEPRYGMPSFVQVLERVRDAYDQQPAQVRDQGERIQKAFEQISPRAGDGVTLDAAPLDAAADWLKDSLDKQHGGFGGAPKFPHPDSVEFLLRRWAQRGDAMALDAALLTLRRMAEGGIYDHLGGGFARYSVDAYWQIPHFEKMLYDNAWLLRLYADAWAITREPLFQRVCEETCAWIIREMQAPDGGYYSSLDADSEGEEGKYYVWQQDEVRALLAPEELAVATAVYGLDRPRNFENHAWHLAIARNLEDVAGSLGIGEPRARELLDSARAKLLQAREKRVRPGRDDKVLASWNALMIRGMAHAARVFGREDWLASARAALDALRRTLWVDGHLLATARDGRAHLDAYLDDHAYLLAALLELLEGDFRDGDLTWATELAQGLMADFQDPAEGGFFFTSHDHETLIHRPKPGPDNATPSGNATAAWALNRLSMLTGDAKLTDAARRTVALFWPQVQRQPSAFGTLLAALQELLEPPRTLILTGDPAALGPWRALLDNAYLPQTAVLRLPPGAQKLPEALAKPVRDGVTAWLCEGLACRAPIASPEELQESLGLRTIAPSPKSVTAPRS